MAINGSTKTKTMVRRVFRFCNLPLEGVVAFLETYLEDNPEKGARHGNGPSNEPEKGDPNDRKDKVVGGHGCCLYSKEVAYDTNPIVKMG